MALVRLIYSSIKTEGVELSDLLRLLDKATKKNKRHGITGLLCFNEDSFLQALEGDALAINQLYRKIIVDSRHTEVDLIHYSSVFKREFPDWAMGFFDLDAISTNEREIESLPRIIELDSKDVLCFLKKFSKTLHR